VALVQKLNARWNLNGRPMAFIWDMPNWYDQFSLSQNGVTKTWSRWVCRHLERRTLLLHGGLTVLHLVPCYLALHVTHYRSSTAASTI